VMNERGYITITDRTKDMFIVGGFNAYPAEIENMINEHPSVASVAIIGVPDERMGEVGYAYVIPRLNATITPDELRTWCRDKMANSPDLFHATTFNLYPHVSDRRVRIGRTHPRCVCTWTALTAMVQRVPDRRTPHVVKGSSLTTPTTPVRNDNTDGLSHQGEDACAVCAPIRPGCRGCPER